MRLTTVGSIGALCLWIAGCGQLDYTAVYTAIAQCPAWQSRPHAASGGRRAWDATCRLDRLPRPL